MKTYVDKLRECPIEILESLIEKQEADIKIALSDLELMKRILSERSESISETK